MISRNKLIKYDWLGHIIEAAFIAAFLCLALWWLSAPLEAAIVGAFMHFHGREKRDCELWRDMKPPHLKAYWFGYWNRDQLTDFFPVLICGVAALLVIDNII